VAKVIALGAPSGDQIRRLGFMAGQIPVPDDFDRMGSSGGCAHGQGKGMKLLLDTAAGEPSRLSTKTRRLLNDANNELLFSAASFWEVAMKGGLGREDFQVDPRLLRRGLLDNGYKELPILSAHVVAIETLPPIHTDPFDRLLVAQAAVEGIMLLTLGPVVAEYPGPIQRHQSLIR
jgi:PIN domain nuclease of toxin-antitoxin system